MGAVVFKIALLLLLITWSGYCVYRLASGLLDGWTRGRLSMPDPRDKVSGRVVRSSARPVEFWFTMVFLHAMLLLFGGALGLGVYGVWRVVLAR